MGLAFIAGATVAIAACALPGSNAAAATPPQAPSPNVVPASVVGSLGSITCPTTSTCLAAGESALGAATVGRTTDGGSTWSFSAVRGAYDLDQVTCASASRCLLAGSAGSRGAIFTSSNSGLSWSPVPLPAGTDAVSGIGCAPSSALCVAGATTGNLPLGTTQSHLGSAVLLSTDSGSRWAELDPLTKGIGPGSSSYYPVTCPAAKTCMVAGFGLSTSTSDSGATWHSNSNRYGGDILSISCAPSGRCLGVGTEESQEDSQAAFSMPGPTSTWSLALWQSGSGPPWLGRLDGISCPSAADCVAVGQSSQLLGAAMLIDNFSTYRQATVPATVLSLAAVTCTGPRSCIAVGTTTADTLAIVRTTDGLHWAEV